MLRCGIRQRGIWISECIRICRCRVSVFGICWQSVSYGVMKSGDGGADIFPVSVSWKVYDNQMQSVTGMAMTKGWFK